ncbi:hypothetical protein BpHYR1_040851 [Brachionus plicatilis]|uniref:Uncharacterized protein n=1 Tax=Brachionus plicatilis TaxID=10195 RepID=A0A3M7SM03_BRAPC|nr:hypothetical protein BpHYR1_040851 [Brachionus plicatilis]
MHLAFLDQLLWCPIVLDMGQFGSKFTCSFHDLFLLYSSSEKLSLLSTAVESSSSIKSLSQSITKLKKLLVIFFSKRPAPCLSTPKYQITLVTCAQAPKTLEPLLQSQYQPIIGSFSDSFVNFIHKQTLNEFLPGSSWSSLQKIQINNFHCDLYAQVNRKYSV